jgi:iron-sulfur cluster insertion protein
MITITEKAADKLNQFTEDFHAIRFMVIGGGCAGYSYDMDYEEELREDDEVYEQHGIKIFVDPLSLVYLEGTEVDYVETLEFSGFKFNIYVAFVATSAAMSCSNSLVFVCCVAVL